MSVTVDGNDYTAPKTFTWIESAAHTIGVDSPQSSYVFNNWSDGKAQTHGITVSSAVTTYTANFNAVTQYSLTVSASPTAGGTVAPNGVTSHNDGAVVNLTASPNTGYRFVNWTGGTVADANSLNTIITMDADKTVTAVFAEIATEYTLTVSASGSGTVTKNPNKSKYNAGESVTLTASPNSGWQFDHWTGNLTGSVNPATITMNANKTITAVFAAIGTEYTLTVSVSGSGTVTKNPNKSKYNAGESVTLTASPNSGWQFDHWTGGLTGSVNPATITMNANKTITAVFLETGTPPDPKKKGGGCSFNNSTHIDFRGFTGYLLPFLLIFLCMAIIRRRHTGVKPT